MSTAEVPQLNAAKLKQLIHAVSSGIEVPPYMQVRLGEWRERVNRIPADLAAELLPAYILKFKEDTKDLPDAAIVVINNGELSILVDGDDNLLTFA